MTWDGNGIDPWLPERLAAEARITGAERRLHDAWLASISRWLVKTKRGVFANGPNPDPAAVFTTAPDWAQEMDRFVQGPVKDTMGVAYADLFGDGYQFDSRPAVTAHLADVHNRMVRTTDDVFGLIAGEVAHGANAGESVDDIAARVGRVLDATGTERWPNRAVTVARTETVGALNAGRTDSFAAVADELGEPMEQMWLSTIDARTRPAHAAADGQRVPVGQPFTVGGSELKFPGDPAGPAATVINCRCSTLLVKPGEEVDLTNRQYTADDWDAWHESQQQAADTGQPVEDPPPRDLETEARQRQARIDGARASGAAAAELDEIITAGASPQAIEHRIAAQVARGALPPDVADEMRAALAAGDLDGVRAVGWRHAGKQGAVRVGDAGDVVPYDRKLHQAIDGGDIRSGQQAIVIRPGTRWVDEGRLLNKAAVEAATPDDLARVAAARLPSAKAPPLGDLFDTAMAGRDRSGKLDKATFARWIEGDYAGLRVAVTRADADWFHKVVRVQGSIRNSDGKSIGRFSRAFGRDDDGRLYVVHELLKIQKQYQGSGFQAQFNGNLLDWYRRSGVAYVKVGANIDVGGYTWARSGYDFATVYDALDLYSRLQNRLSEIAGEPLRQLRWLDEEHTEPAYVWDGPAVFEATPAWSMEKLRKAFKGASDAEIERQLRLGRAFVDGLAGRTFGDDLPSAYELSQLGRWAGAGKNDVWIGKQLMLGSSWLGVLWL